MFYYNRSPTPSPSNSATLTALELDVSDSSSTLCANITEATSAVATEQTCLTASSSSDVRSAESTEHPISLECTTPAGKSVEPATSSVSTSAESTDHVRTPPVIGPLTLDEHIKAVQLQIESDFLELQQCKEDVKKYREMCLSERVIADVEKIVELCEGVCDVESCKKKRRVIEQKLEAGVLVVKFCCEKGHDATWCSSKVLAEKRGQKIYVSPTLMAAAVLVTGNNFEKVSLFAKCLNLNFVSQSTFTRIQTHYVIPTIKELWGVMKEKIWNLFKSENLIMCGDGRMDSPGFSAKYCLYTMMDHYLDLIVDCEVVDKREAGGISSLMEKMGCKRILERMIGILQCQELVTDASSVIMKMVRELKGTLAGYTCYMHTLYMETVI